MTIIDLQAYLEANRSTVKRFEVRQQLCRKFKVRSLANLPEDRAGAAYELARTIIDYWTAKVQATAILQQALAVILVDAPTRTPLLAAQLDNRLRKRGDAYWAAMSVEDAVTAIRQEIGDMNVWEFAFSWIE